jgi:glycosyltransferase involved in cell wall biosynthesis
VQKAQPTVHILLASYQGELYLKEQLASLSFQTYSHWQLHVSDDGSTDSTLDVVTEFASTSPQAVHICSGPGKGATHNFFNLINTVAATHPGDVYAFCDQDDVWLPDKLAKAVAHFEAQTLAPSQPYLYCSRTFVVDHLLKQRGLTPLPRKPLGFGNALLQNVASGNTMVFNLALLKIMRLISPQHSVLHDWTAYQAVTGCGGMVYFSEQPSLLYRQHGANVVGSNIGFASRVRRLQFMFSGGYKTWSLQTIRAMQQIAALLTEQSQAEVYVFQAMHSSSNPYNRLRLALNKTLWRQSRLGQASLAVALLLDLI